MSTWCPKESEHNSMSIDGTKIAEDMAKALAERVKALPRAPRLCALYAAPTFATTRFLAIKKARARSIGITLDAIELGSGIDTAGVVAAVTRAAGEYEGVLVQLPFPSPVDVEAVLAAVPYVCDVDGIGSEAVRRLAHGDTEVLPPVVGAIRAIARSEGVDFSGMRAVVVGAGRLVGQPAAVWLRQQGAKVVVLTEETKDLAAETTRADVLVLGAGVPGLIRPEMVKEGVLLFDAGTSEAAGKLVGDADPACAERAALFTPVPGGIGPITVSVIFENLLALGAERAA